MRLALLFLLPCLPVAAAPSVVTDIPPVGSLVAQVMEGVGEPAVLVPGTGSPHDFALRPSEAAVLQDAEVLVWVGPELTPWLEQARDALAPASLSVPLLSATGAGDAADPHAWLDPKTATAWLRAIASALGQADPQNAVRYDANAAKGAERIAEAVVKVEAVLAPFRAEGQPPFAVYHDAYGAFEARFGLTAIPFADHDGDVPGPGSVAAFRARLEAEGVRCLFLEPQRDPRRAAALAEGLDVTVRVLDPLGAQLAPGPDLYPALIEQLAQDLAGCLGES